jgi:hypothetical protein
MNDLIILFGILGVTLFYGIDYLFSNTKLRDLERFEKSLK